MMPSIPHLLKSWTWRIEGDKITHWCFADTNQKDEKTLLWTFSCVRYQQCLLHSFVEIEAMAPIAIDPTITDVAQPRKDTLGLPAETRKRLEKAGIDLSDGYPYRPARPLYLQDVYDIRNEDRDYVDPGSRADPSKKSLLGAAEKVVDLTAHIGTEIVGLQLKDLTDQQKDELGLLIAERSVVFFRDQDISPQQQKELGQWFGEIEVHVR